MRLVPACTLLLGLLSLSSFSLLRVPRQPSLDTWVPDDALALVALQNPPPNLDFLNRIGRQNELVSSLVERIPDELEEQLAALFQQELEAAWFVIHGLSRQPEGSWRLEFSALLVPRPLRRELLKLRIELAVHNLFGVGRTRSLRADPVRIYTGSREGEILYQILLPRLVLISNSQDAWQKTLRVVGGREKSLAQDRGFRKIKNHLLFKNGLFFYLNAHRIFSLLPRLGYTLEWKEGRWVEEYYEVGGLSGPP